MALDALTRLASQVNHASTLKTMTQDHFAHQQFTKNRGQEEHPEHMGLDSKLLAYFNGRSYPSKLPQPSMNAPMGFMMNSGQQLQRTLSMVGATGQAGSHTSFDQMACSSTAPNTATPHMNAQMHTEGFVSHSAQRGPGSQHLGGSQTTPAFKPTDPAAHAARSQKRQRHGLNSP